MKRILRLVLFLLLSTVFRPAEAQVTISGSTGLDGVYGDLTAALLAIELGADQLGNNIVFTITANIPAEPGGALLHGRNWNSLRIIPSGARTVTTNWAGWLIGLANAEHVTIDGLNAGGNSLTLINTSSASLGSILMIANNSSYDTLRNVTCRSRGVNDAVITISNSVTGNHHNLIENCDIGAAAGGTPQYGFASISGPLNNDNTIRNCSIHDIYNTTLDSYGIYIAFGAGRTIIEDNHIYQTASRIPASGNPVFTGIGIGFTDGDGFIIRNNLIGGNAADGSGYSVFGSSTSGGAFVGISVKHNGFIPASLPSRTEITGNRIRGVTMTSNKSNNAGGIGQFIGIYLANGTNTDSVRCSNNVIGGISGNDSIIVTAFATVAVLPSHAIRTASTRGNTIDSNTVGAITLDAGGARMTAFIAIQCDLTSAASTIQVRKNTIGNADVPNSIRSNHNGAGGNLVGIRVAGNNPNALFRIRENTIQNLEHSGANAGTGVVASVLGIVSVTNAINHLEIENNIVRNLRNTDASATATEVAGIRWIPHSGVGAAATPALITKNQVYGLSIPNSTSANSKVSGLIALPGVQSYITNNMVSVGDGSHGKVYAIDLAGSSSKLYNNSFRVTGSGAIAEGAALLRSVISTTDARNNIYYNDRSGAPNNQYAVNFVPGFNSVAPYTGSNNLYYSSGPNIAGNSGNNYTSAIAFNTVLNSVAPNAELISRTAAVNFSGINDLHTTDIDVVNAGADLSAAIPAVSSDFDGDARNSCFDIGADEVNYSAPPNAATWTGSVDTRWCTPCNWDKGSVPAATDDVTIPEGLTRFPVLSTAAACGIAEAHHLIITSSAAFFIQAGGVLELNGDFNNNGVYSHPGGDLVLTGTALQTIHSVTTPLNIFNLHLHGTGLKQLNTAVNINGTLTCTSGNLAITHHALRAAATSGGSLGSHVITDGTGLLTVPAIGAGPVIFPVGPTAASYNPLRFSNGQNIDYSVRVETGINPNIAFPGIAVNRTWTINSSANPAAAVNVQFEYANGHANAGFNYSGNVEVGRYINPAWNVVQGGITPVGSYQVNSSLQTFNGGFAIGNIGAILSSGLQVKCRAQLSGNAAVLVQWNCSAVDDIEYFQAERYEGNGVYLPVATVNTITGELSYRFTDNSPSQGLNSYRIRVVRSGNRIVYSNTVFINRQAAAGLQLLAVYPNPVQTVTTLTVQAATKRTGRLLVYTSTGRMAAQKTFVLEKGVNLLTPDLSALPAGYYTLILTDEKLRQQVQVVKQ